MGESREGETRSGGGLRVYPQIHLPFPLSLVMERGTQSLS